MKHLQAEKPVLHYRQVFESLCDWLRVSCPERSENKQSAKADDEAEKDIGAGEING